MHSRDTGRGNSREGGGAESSPTKRRSSVICGALMRTRTRADASGEAPSAEGQSHVAATCTSDESPRAVSALRYTAAAAGADVSSTSRRDSVPSTCDRSEPQGRFLDPECCRGHFLDRCVTLGERRSRARDAGEGSTDADRSPRTVRRNATVSISTANTCCPPRPTQRRRTPPERRRTTSLPPRPPRLSFHRPGRPSSSATSSGARLSSSGGAPAPDGVHSARGEKREGVSAWRGERTDAAPAESWAPEQEE